MSKKIKLKFSTILYLSLCIGVFYVLHFLNLPDNTLLWQSINNTGHIPLFGIWSLLLLGFISSVFEKKYEVVRYYIAAYLITISIGAFSELIQIFSSRDADVNDLIRNVVGATLFLVSFALYDNRMNEFWRKKNKRIRDSAIVLIISLIIYSITPVFILGVAYIHRNNNFPVICNFESSMETKFWSVNNAKLDIITSPVFWSEDHNNNVGKLIFKPAKYSGFRIDELIGNWNSFKYLSFEIYSELDSSIFITLKIEDFMHNDNYYDRFNKLLEIVHGNNYIRISLNDVEVAPKFRTMDLSEIKTIEIFASDIKSQISIYIDNIKLE